MIIVFYLQNKRKSGEGGIRTHETVQHRLRDFQSRSFGQLGHLSVPGEFTKWTADRVMPGRALNFGPFSKAADQEPRPDRHATQDRPPLEIVVGLYVLFFVLVVVEIVEEPGPEEKVREGAVPDAIVGAVVVSAAGVCHARRDTLVAGLLRGGALAPGRSEERRVGKECRSRW